VVAGGVAGGAAGAVLREAAPAKVNLALHVVGRRDDGYHLLDSLVCFPGIGDLLEAEPARGLSLAVSGPFGDGLGTGADNLVIRAAEAMRPPGRGAALMLVKRLPVAAGIGGGSADAAAALRLLARLWGVAVPGPEALLALGADVPVCLGARAARMGGIGEVLAPVALPAFWLVLVNPRVPVATGAVFASLAGRYGEGLGDVPARFASAGALVGWLAARRNDLEAPAVAAVPVIAEVLAALAAQPGCGLARMSGSGATCFGMFAEAAEARAAAAAIAAAAPGWWVAEAPVEGGGAASLRTE
jgi:4-diphosphocytidyl-2-C-methyl-D-erythritol kinase